MLSLAKCYQNVFFMFSYITICKTLLYIKLCKTVFSCISDRIFQWFAGAGKFRLTQGGVGWVSRFEWRHISWRHEIFMNECCCKLTSLEIYEWMRKFIHYYKNIKLSYTQTIKSFVPIFILKMICKKKKLSLVTGTDGIFRLSGDCFCSTSAEPRYCVNSLPRDRKIPSALVSSERFLYFCRVTALNNYPRARFHSLYRKPM